MLLQIRALSLAGFGLVANLSQGSWIFLKDLPHLLHLDISDNAGLVGDFPSQLSASFESICATGTGATAVTHATVTGSPLIQSNLHPPCPSRLSPVSLCMLAFTLPAANLLVLCLTDN